MTIVSNASPLIGIARIDRLDLLRELYGELVIPEAVWQEVVVKGAGQAGAELITAASWIKKMQVTNRALVQGLSQELDSGEAEAIALALEVGAEVLLSRPFFAFRLLPAHNGGEPQDVRQFR